jgi:hypothetical protein
MGNLARKIQEEIAVAGHREQMDARPRYLPFFLALYGLGQWAIDSWEGALHFRLG